MSNPSIPPPSYTSTSPPKTQYGSTESQNVSSSDSPLLNNQSKPLYNPNQNGNQYASGSNAPRNDWLGEGDDEGDVPEDFKIGMTVSQSSQDVRNAFIRKVYGVLFCQILGTTLVGALMSTESAVAWTREHSGLMLIPMFGAFVSMFGVYWKRHSHPLNLILLATFTGLEAITIGSVVSYYNQTVVLQALVITSFVFIGLTLFTFQSKYDFEKMGSYLFAALLVFFMTGLVGIFLPFSKTMDMLMAGAGVMIFSLYIIYDTHVLLRTLHCDDWVVACVSLYLDILNLFLQILRLLQNIEDR